MVHLLETPLVVDLVVPLDLHLVHLMVVMWVVGLVLMKEMK